MQQALMTEAGEFHAHNGRNESSLAILPLFRRHPAGHEYLSLHQALQQHNVEISEISEHGSVPQLKVNNKGQLPVLILDGEELIGAKQNRVLNTSVLVAGGTELVVPVSCTEAGRWHYSSGNMFRESDHVMSPRIRSGKAESVSQNLRGHGGYRSDQGKVWDDIDKMHAEHGTHSPTGAMSDAYAARERDLERLLGAFPLLEGQCGIYVQIGGAFAGLDLVSLPVVWRDLHDKIVRSYIMDALLEKRQAEPVDPERFESWQAGLGSFAVESFPGVGLGTELRLEAEGSIGSALLWEDALTHLAVYPRQQHPARYPRYHNPRRHDN